MGGSCAQASQAHPRRKYLQVPGLFLYKLDIWIFLRKMGCMYEIFHLKMLNNPDLSSENWRWAVAGARITWWQQELSRHHCLCQNLLENAVCMPSLFSCSPKVQFLRGLASCCFFVCLLFCSVFFIQLAWGCSSVITCFLSVYPGFDSQHAASL